MPVTSSRRYSSGSYLTPSSSSSLGTYRSSNYSSNYSSSTVPTATKDYSSSTTSRYTSGYNSGDTSYRKSGDTSAYRTTSDTTSSYRSTYRPSLTTSSLSSSTNTYRSRYNFDDDNDKKTTSSTTAGSSLSTRIGVSKTSSTRLKSDTLPPLPPSSSSALNYGHSKRSLSRSREVKDSAGESTSGTFGSSTKNGSDRTNGKLSLMNDTDFYEKYSPSRYMTKYELSRSRSLTSEAAQTTPTRDNISPSSTPNSLSNDTPTHTPKSEIRSVALRNALPTTSSSRTWDRDYTSGSSLYRNGLSDKTDKSESRNGLSSYAAGGYRASNISPSKSPARDYDSRKATAVEGQTGLWNIGNTCFMNSVLQCLSQTTDLSKFSRSSSAASAVVDKGSTSSSKDQKIWAEFCKLIGQMWQAGAKSVNPSDLKMALSSKYRMYSGSAQQDAQEFLRYLLEALHGALNTGGQKISLHIEDDMSDLEKANVMWDWYTKRENSVIKDLFVGQLKSSLFCTHCEKTSVMYDPFWDLSVPVPSTPNCKLDKCLEAFTVKDVLDGNEMPYCDYCKTTRKCIKGFTIQRFPKYLVIHLKRFSEMRWTKLTNIVDFPTGVAELDLTPYASESMEKKDPAPIYSLYGISNHMGSTHGGHYVAACKHPVTKKWFEYNDNFVSETRESSLVSSSAYLLFFERV